MEMKIRKRNKEKHHKRTSDKNCVKEKREEDKIFLKHELFVFV